MPTRNSSRNGTAEYNKDCLEGMRCPRCGATEPFDIVGTAVFAVRDEGAEAFHSLDWNPTSPCTCASCRYSGRAAAFRVGAKRHVTLTFPDGTTHVLTVEYSSPLADHSLWSVHPDGVCASCGSASLDRDGDCLSCGEAADG